MKKYLYSDEEAKFLEKSQVPFAVYQFINKRVVTLILSRGFFDLFGFNWKDKEAIYYLLDNDMYRDAHPDDLAVLGNEAYRFATEGGNYDVVYRFLRDGEYRIIHAVAMHIYKEDGTRLAFVQYADLGAYTEEGVKGSDETLNALKNQLIARSMDMKQNYDFLTGLPAMSHFFELAETGCEEIREQGKNPAVLFMDFNGMKTYNQKYGMEEGDNFLKNFAQILISNFGRDNASRFSADHFCVLTDREDALVKAEKIIEANEKNGKDIGMSLRIGIYNYDDETVSISGACDRAKIACDSGRNIFQSKIYNFQISMIAEREEKQYIVDNLDRGINEGWIKVYYQPIIRIANGRVCSEESLARWEDPVKGMLCPKDFIPALEESNSIYKLDLYVVDSVIKKMKEQKARGLYVVPGTINLSRSDFYTCDIVEEIRQRVDDSGLSRDLFIIEITESILAEDMEYMTAEVKRFKALGFPVWMDDYGSGYSSPLILQNLPFDLIKIDMLFVKKLGSDEKSKIIVTEIVRLAMALGMDTVAEGVENEEQAEFLKNIGCTMLQGHYFCKPITKEAIFSRYEAGVQIGFENPKESEYFAKIGRVNLYDLSVPRGLDESLKNYFDTWPMIMVECNGDRVSVVRHNSMFLDFAKNNFSRDYLKTSFKVSDYKGKPGGYSFNAVIQCAMDGKSVILDERTSKGMNLQILLWRVAVNKYTNVSAVMAVILSAVDNTGGGSNLTYNYIARALSEDYLYLYFVDLDTGEYTEFVADGANRDISVEKHGKDFFGDLKDIAKNRVHEDDRKGVLRVLDKGYIENHLKKNGSVTFTYREWLEDGYVYLSLKVIKIRNGKNNIIIGVNNVDSQMKQKEALESIREEQISFSRIAALYGDFMSAYIIDPVTDEYIQFSSTTYYDSMETSAQGEDFYGTAREAARSVVYGDDQDFFMERFNKETVMDEIVKTGMFSLRYRLVIEGKPVHVLLRATLIHEHDADKVIIGIINVDSEVKKQEEYELALSAMATEASTDELTGAKRKYGYRELETQLNREIRDKMNPQFAVAVFDINDLKQVNDTMGHLMGDRYIIDGYNMISTAFSNSPVFRLGGDEFAVIVQGEDYNNLDEHMAKIEKQNLKNKQAGKVVIAAGMSRFERDRCVEDVFQRADSNMYLNKKALKGQ